MAFNYAEKETVLCFHGPLLYEAKVLKIENRTDADTPGPHYLVHYKGWKQKWDEWVPETRMLKMTDDNRLKQKQLVESTKAASGSAASSSSSKRKDRPSGAGAGGSDRKRGRESVVDTEAEYLKRPEIRIPIPDTLKVQLVDDWEAITKNNQLVPLPRKPSVHDFLQTYLAQHPSSASSSSAQTTSTLADPKARAVLLEVLAGLELYFNRALGANLLYRFERPQYVEQRKRVDRDVPEGQEGREMSFVYGAEHFLRLIVNLPAMLAFTTIDAESVKVLQEHVQDLLKWIIKNRDTLLLKEYENSSPQYQNLVTGGS